MLATALRESLDQLPHHRDEPIHVLLPRPPIDEARAEGHPADTVDELRSMVRDAVECHFDEEERPRVIHLHFVRDELIAV